MLKNKSFQHLLWIFSGKTITVFNLLLFSAIFFMYSCEEVTLEPIEITDDITFNEDIVPILNSCSATSCHGGNVSPNLSEGVAYENLSSGGYLSFPEGAPEESDLYKKLTSGSHYSRTNPEEKQIILKWISEGAQNN